ncbi:MAG: hypothetical protein QM811_19415 [Pirellulales bacterium]
MLAIAILDDFALPRGHFFGHPRGAAGLVQFLRQRTMQRREIPDIVQRVIHLSIAERTLPPIGAGFALFQRHAQQAIQQRAVTGRIIVPDETRGELHVEQRVRRLTRRFEAEIQFLATGVRDGHMARRNQEIPEWSNVVDLQRIDDRQVRAGGDLNQTQFRAVSMLADEFRIEADRRFVAKGGAKLDQFPIRDDMLKRHANRS